MTQPQKISKHCHKEIRRVAKEAAGALYEVVMSDNLVFAEWKRQNPDANAECLLSRFVDRNWPRCIPFARATLAQMLTTQLDDKTKESIMEVLTLDATLMRGRTPAPMILAKPN